MLLILLVTILLLLLIYDDRDDSCRTDSEMYAILDFPVASIQTFPIRTTGHDFLHSCRHFFGLHLSALTIAMRVNLSDIVALATARVGWCTTMRIYDHQPRSGPLYL